MFMKNICFVIPQMKDGWLKMEYSSREALGVQYICSSLEQNKIPYTLINAHAYHIEDEDVCEEIIKNNFDIIGVTCISQRSYPNVRNFIKTLRDTYHYKGIVFIGGFFATLAYKEILKDLEGYIDFLTRGEGELIIPEIVKELSSGVEIHNIKGIVYLDNNQIFGDETTHYINDLNVLPYPIRDAKLLENVAGEPKNFKMLAGRGCYNNCSFCSIIIDGRPRRKRYRSPENVVGEIEMLLNNYDVTHFRFCDEIFYTNTPYGKNWVDTFVNLVKAKNLNFTFHIEMRAIDITKEELLKLKEIGLVCVSIGYESGVQRILDEMRKHCTVEDNLRASKILKEIGIDNAISFITLIPTMTFDELKTNYSFLKEIGGYTAHNLYNKLNLYIGCEYENILAKARFNG